ncbi:hypothetical protein [Acidisphaera sp. L21]|uniref:hypothetical protein n=1 Tax=Acidisphaera sp. L21 TaxID=1641851 RepID=UPI00131DB6CE|nr:hypothetical protein [Acidisphaera sp. L21]
MADAGEQRTPAAAEVETPADFLANLGNALRGKENVDVGLADILAKHLLTASPAVDALSKAKDAILKLAAERADPPNPEAANG